MANWLPINVVVNYNLLTFLNNHFCDLAYGLKQVMYSILLLYYILKNSYSFRKQCLMAVDLSEISREANYAESFVICVYICSLFYTTNK